MEVTFKKTGDCRQCGWCCQNCVHLIPKFDGVRPGKYKCAIYSTRDQFCKICNQYHAGCQAAPDVPFRKWNPDCGYSFLLLPSEAEIIEFVFLEWEWFEKYGSRATAPYTITSSQD